MSPQPPQTYHILPSRKPDIPALVRLDFAAHADDPIHRHLYPIPATESMVAHKCSRMAENFGKDPHAYMYHVVEEAQSGGEIAASIEWEFVDETKAWEWKVPKLGPQWNRERVERIQRAHVARMGEVMEGKRAMFLETLETSPNHRRRGLATMLLKKAIAAAAAANLPIFLTASPSGVPLYAKNGFLPYSTFTVDIPPVYHHVDQILIHPAPFPETPQPTKLPSPLSRLVVAETKDPADYMHVVLLEDIAMQNEPFIDIVFRMPADAEAARQARAQNYAEDAEEGRLRLTLAKDTLTDTVVGAGRWEFVDEEDPEAREDPPFDEEKWGPGTNKELANAMFGGLYEERVGAMKGRKYIYMHILMVEPGWQRLGVGAKVLKWGLDQADRKGLPCWVDSSKVGEGLYKRMGWVVKGSVVVDEGEYGVPGRKHETVYMLREPRAWSGEDQKD